MLKNNLICFYDLKNLVYIIFLLKNFEKINKKVSIDVNELLLGEKKIYDDYNIYNLGICYTYILRILKDKKRYKNLIKNIDYLYSLKKKDIRLLNLKIKNVEKFYCFKKYSLREEKIQQNFKIVKKKFLGFFNKKKIKKLRKKNLYICDFIYLNTVKWNLEKIKKKIYLKKNFKRKNNEKN